MLFDNYYTLIIAYILGVITGVIAMMLATKDKQKNVDKSVSLLICGLWLGFHTIGFFSDLKVPLIFDIVGAGATGHIIGIDLVEKVIKVIKK